MKRILWRVQFACGTLVLAAVLAFATALVDRLVGQYAAVGFLFVLLMIVAPPETK